jgi:hypothetical protein
MYSCLCASFRDWVQCSPHPSNLLWCHARVEQPTLKLTPAGAQSAFADNKRSSQQPCICQLCLHGVPCCMVLAAAGWRCCSASHVQQRSTMIHNSIASVSALHAGASCRCLLSC